MKTLLRSAVFAVCSLPIMALAQGGAGRTVEIRALLNDPLNPGARFQVATAPKVYNKLALVAEGFSTAVKVEAQQGVIALYGPQGSDPKVAPPVLASTTVGASTQRCLLVIYPLPAAAAPADGKPAEGKPTYGMVAIDDTGAAFPFGESRVVNLTKVTVALEAGEHKVSIPGEKITPLPAVTKLNNYNVAQTNFMAMAAGKLVPFTERQLQYVKTIRRVFVVYVNPGAVAPEVKTVSDYEPVVLPR